MITFKLLKPLTTQVSVSDQVFTVFPNEPAADGSIALLSVPEDMVSENVLSWPGEYDHGGVAVRGIGHDAGEKVSFLMIAENVRCAFLAEPLHTWGDEEFEQLGNADVLVMPVNSVKIMQKLVDEIDPRILIALDNGEGSYNEALKELGAENVEPVSEYKIKSSLPSEGREVVILQS